MKKKSKLKRIYKKTKKGLKKQLRKVKPKIEQFSNYSARIAKNINNMDFY